MLELGKVKVHRGNNARGVFFAGSATVYNDETEIRFRLSDDAQCRINAIVLSDFEKEVKKKL